MRNGSLPGELDAAQERAAGDAGGRKEDVISLHQRVGVKDLGKVDARFLNGGFFRFGLGSRRASMAPPAPLMAQAANTPSGVPPVPIMTSTSER